MDQNINVQEAVKTTTTVHDITNTDSELYKIGMYSTAAFAAAVGGWGLFCLSTAVMETGGPLSLLKSLFQAMGM